MSSREGGLREIFPVPPGGGLVVGGAGLEASVQDADEPVGESSECVVVLESAGAELVVVGAGAGRGAQRGEGLGVERVDQPVVMHVAGGDDFLLARRAGDGACGRVVAA